MNDKKVNTKVKILRLIANRKSDRAITLIALIVTIIVLLVIAGVTIANVMGNQGVIKKSKIATNNYDTQSANEEMELFLMGLGNDITGDRLVDYLKNYVGNDGLEDFQNNGDGTVQLVLNGKKYTLKTSDLSFTYDGHGTGVVRNLRQVLNNNNQNVPGVAMVGAGDIETEDLGWEVLKDNGSTVDLIAINNTNFEVSLSGLNGYTNGVKALNDICNRLYGNLEINGTKVKSARNVSLTDLYNVSYNVIGRYPSNVEKAQPKINALDTGFDKSGTTNGYSTEQIKDYVTDTSSMLNSNATGVILKSQSTSSIEATNLVNTGNSYWFATRESWSKYDSNKWAKNGGDTVEHRQEYYGLYFARIDGVISSNDLYNIDYTSTSGGDLWTTTNALRPVITVDGSLISDKTIGAKVSTDPFHKSGNDKNGYVSADSLAQLLGRSDISITKADAGLPTAESDMTWTKLPNGGYNSVDGATGSFDTSKYDYYIADRTTKLQVKLVGAQGYNNGVLALDTICNDIYGGETSIKLSNGKTKNVKVKQARNAKFEDFWDESKIRKSTTSEYGATYSTDESKASSTDYVITEKNTRWTPSIYRLESLDVNNPSSGYSDSKIKSYNLSNNTAYYNDSKNNTSLTDENMNSYSAEYRYPDITVMYNALWGTGANTNTAVSTKTSNSQNYWLSSRCVNANWGSAGFRLRYVSGGGSLNTINVFYSTTIVTSTSYGLRPVLVVEK